MIVGLLFLLTFCDAWDDNLKAGLQEIKNIISEQNERIIRLEAAWKEQQIENARLKIIIDKQQSDISKLQNLKSKDVKPDEKTQNLQQAEKMRTEIGTNHNDGHLEESHDVNKFFSSPDGKVENIKFSAGHEETAGIRTLNGYSRNSQMKVKFNKEKRLLMPAPTISSVSTVAFYAYMSKTETNVGPHHTLIFDHVETNIGNAYNQHTGIFTAPTSGVYMFSYTVYPYTNSRFSIEITVNSVGKGTVYIAKYTGELYGSTGNAIFLLNHGDVCFIRTLPSYTDALGNIRSDIYMRTSFSGFKISA